MSVIQRVGNTEFWEKPRCPDQPLFAMPICEEAVLETAFSPVYAGLRRLSKDAASNCVSRYRMRRILPDKLNPRWQKLPWPDDERIIIKDAASCANSGVWQIARNDYAKHYLKYAFGDDGYRIIEEFIPGNQWEQDGFIIGGRIHFFKTLRQSWDREGRRICAYHNETLVDMQSLVTEAAEEAVRAVGLDDCPFCVEIRFDTEAQPKIIEIAARLGEDHGLPDLLNPDEYPLSVVERCAERAIDFKTAEVSG